MSQHQAPDVLGHDPVLLQLLVLLELDDALLSVLTEDPVYRERRVLI